MIAKNIHFTILARTKTYNAVGCNIFEKLDQVEVVLFFGNVQWCFPGLRIGDGGGSIRVARTQRKENYFYRKTATTHVVSPHDVCIVCEKKSSDLEMAIRAGSV